MYSKAWEVCVAGSWVWFADAFSSHSTLLCHKGKEMLGGNIHVEFKHHIDPQVISKDCVPCIVHTNHSISGVHTHTGT